MRDDLLEILCCPVCRGDLTLAVTRRDEQEIVEGTLTCARCPATYPIADGIPDLLPPPER
jgi:uncharacterized protein YbaR (Trm112 family)